MLIVLFLLVFAALASDHGEEAVRLVHPSNATANETNATRASANESAALPPQAQRKVGDDDVVEAIREFESELEAEVTREERESGAIGDSKLSQLGHAAVVSVLSSRETPHWSLLGALSKSFEAARTRNAARIESFVAAAMNATLSSFAFDDDDPKKAEASATEAWRQRLALDDGQQEMRNLDVAERHLIRALRLGALRNAYVALAGKTIEAKSPRLPATNDTLRDSLAEATTAAESEISALFYHPNEDNETVRSDAVELAREASAKASRVWRERNQRAAREGGQEAVRVALEDLRRCLADVPEEAKVGLGHFGAVTLCEADASMRWLEIDEPIQSLFRDSHRRGSSDIVGEFRKTSLDVGTKIQTALNVSRTRIGEVLDSSCSGSRSRLPVDEAELERCARPAMQIVTQARSTALEATSKEHEGIVVERALPLFEFVEARLKKLRDENARASAKCVQEAFAQYSVQVSEYVESVRTNPYNQRKLPPPPTPKRCAGPAASADDANFDHLAQSLRRAKDEANAVLKSTSDTATLAIYATSALKLLVLLCKRLPTLNALCTLLLVAVAALSFLSKIFFTSEEEDDEKDATSAAPPLHLVVAAATLLVDLCCCCRRRSRGRGRRGGPGGRSGGNRQTSLLGKSSFGVGREDDHIA